MFCFYDTFHSFVDIYIYICMAKDYIVFDHTKITSNVLLAKKKIWKKSGQVRVSNV